jgi:hypothetical protein
MVLLSCDILLNKKKHQWDWPSMAIQDIFATIDGKWPCMVLRMQCGVVGADAGGTIFHSLLVGSRAPEMIYLLFNITRICFLSKITWYPESQSREIDSREQPYNSGTTWTCRACAFNAGLTSSASWVDVMMPPFWQCEFGWD